MSRVLAAGASVIMLLSTGCLMTTEAHRSAMADLNQQLDAEQSTVAALSERLAAVEGDKAKLSANLAAAEQARTQAEAAAEASRRAADELKAANESVMGSLATQLVEVPGALVDEHGAMQVTIAFELGGTELSENNMKALQVVANALAGRSGPVYVDGHSDNVALVRADTKKLYIDNLGLSLARGSAVARALTDAKIAPDRIVVRGFGSTRPIMSNDTPEGRAKNRRVEIRFIPSATEPQGAAEPKPEPEREPEAEILPVTEPQE